mgnify:FL=1
MELVADFKSVLRSIDNRILLEKALKTGQMTLTEYLLERKYYYANYDQWLEAEHGAMMALAELAVF